MKKQVVHTHDTGGPRSFDRVLSERELLHLQELDFSRGVLHGAQRMLDAINAGVDPQAFMEALDAWRDRKHPARGFTDFRAAPRWHDLRKGRKQ